MSFPKHYSASQYDNYNGRYGGEGEFEWFGVVGVDIVGGDIVESIDKTLPFELGCSASRSSAMRGF